MQKTEIQREWGTWSKTKNLGMKVYRAIKYNLKLLSLIDFTEPVEIVPNPYLWPNIWTLMNNFHADDANHQTA